nr:penaeidin 4-1 [Penaeus vannamei]
MLISVITNMSHCIFITIIAINFFIICKSLNRYIFFLSFPGCDVCYGIPSATARLCCFRYGDCCHRG